MALTPSSMIPLGTVAPDFNLSDTISGENKSLNDLRGEKGTLIMFICNHCPFVKHVDDKIAEIGNSYKKKEIGVIAISSNDINGYPEDSPEKMKEKAKKFSYTFPYLYDETQSVARAYDATCTPDFFLFDKDLKLVYRGQLDDSRPGNDLPVNGKDLINALDALINNKPINSKQNASIGCNIKWK